MRSHSEDYASRSASRGTSWNYRDATPSGALPVEDFYRKTDRSYEDGVAEFGRVQGLPPGLTDTILELHKEKERKKKMLREGRPLQEDPTTKSTDIKHARITLPPSKLPPISETADGGRALPRNRSTGRNRSPSRTVAFSLPDEMPKIPVEPRLETRVPDSSGSDSDDSVIEILPGRGNRRATGVLNGSTLQIPINATRIVIDLNAATEAASTESRDHVKFGNGDGDQDSSETSGSYYTYSSDSATSSTTSANATDSTKSTSSDSGSSSGLEKEIIINKDRLKSQPKSNKKSNNDYRDSMKTSKISDKIAEKVRGDKKLSFRKPSPSSHKLNRIPPLNTADSPILATTSSQLGLNLPEEYVSKLDAILLDIIDLKVKIASYIEKQTT